MSQWAMHVHGLYNFFHFILLKPIKNLIAKKKYIGRTTRPRQGHTTPEGTAHQKSLPNSPSQLLFFFNAQVDYM
jgi:hypothetical protein